MGLSFEINDNLPESIVGYFQAEYTHLSVAITVAFGHTGCGLSLVGAAQALDFVPLFGDAITW